MEERLSHPHPLTIAFGKMANDFARHFVQAAIRKNPVHRPFTLSDFDAAYFRTEIQIGSDIAVLIEGTTLGQIADLFPNLKGLVESIEAIDGGFACSRGE